MDDPLINDYAGFQEHVKGETVLISLEVTNNHSESFVNIEVDRGKAWNMVNVVSKAGGSVCVFNAEKDGQSVLIIDSEEMNYDTQLKV